MALIWYQVLWIAFMFENCNIRSVTYADLDRLLSWRNHPSIRQFMLTQHEITMEEHCNWFKQASQDQMQRLLIVEDSKAPIGYVHFNSVMPGGISNWGFYTCPAAPKGSGRKLGAIALTHAFKELNLHKVCGQAIDSNEKSQLFHKHLGFKTEGVLRDQHLINGVYHSLMCFGLLAHEWQSLPDIMELKNANH